MAKRRSHGEGTIYENKKRDRWEGQFSYTDPATGKSKRKLITGKTQKEVSIKGKEFLKNIDNGLLPDANKITLWQWIDRWLTDYVKPSVRIKSFDKYETSLRCYIKPTLGNTLMHKIKTPDIQHLLNRLIADAGKKEQVYLRLL